MSEYLREGQIPAGRLAADVAGTLDRLLRHDLIVIGPGRTELCPRTIAGLGVKADNVVVTVNPDIALLPASTGGYVLFNTVTEQLGKTSALAAMIVSSIQRGRRRRAGGMALQTLQETLVNNVSRLPAEVLANTIEQLVLHEILLVRRAAVRTRRPRERSRVADAAQ